jgi:hypothetical protein
VYDYKLDYEMTILGYYYNPRKYDIVGMATKILSTEHASVAICDSVYPTTGFTLKTARFKDRRVVGGFSKI